jgi:hypothetical protein
MSTPTHDAGNTVCGSQQLWSGWPCGYLRSYLTDLTLDIISN